MANRVVLGSFDSTYVLRVSKPGFNVLDPNLSASQLVFDSRWSEFSTIHSEGIAYFAPYQRYVTIPHDLGYRPFGLVWYMASRYQPLAYDTNGLFIECHSFPDRIELDSPPTTGLNSEQIPRDYEFWAKYAIMRVRADG